MFFCEIEDEIVRNDAAMFKADFPKKSVTEENSSRSTLFQSEK